MSKTHRRRNRTRHDHPNKNAPDYTSDEWKGCLKKKRRATVQEAEAAALRLTAVKNSPIRAYRCPHCRWYHLASSRPTNQPLPEHARQ